MTSREFMYMNKNVFTSVSNFRKISINTKRLYACSVPPALFTHKYRGQIMGAVSTTDKTFGPFSEWILARKRHFRGVFSAHSHIM